MYITYFRVKRTFLLIQWTQMHKSLLPIFIAFGTSTLLEFEYITHHTKYRFLNLRNLIIFMKFQKVANYKMDIKM
jgi:hypothetical protein